MVSGDEDVRWEFVADLRVAADDAGERLRFDQVDQLPGEVVFIVEAIAVAESDELL